VYRRVKHWAGAAYATAHDLAPGIRKGADALRRGYQTASENGLIDQLGGKHAQSIHEGARRGFSTYDNLERAATQADGVVRSMRG
jgi:hypothetical protein